MTLGGPSETFPWTLSRKTFKNPELVYCHGSCPFFGGRSLFWSAWCPRPRLDLDELRDFPKKMLSVAKKEEFWERGENLLHVTNADKLDDTVFAGLQRVIDKKLAERWRDIKTATHSMPAPLAVGRASPTSTLRFNKFSTPAPLLKIYDDQKRAERLGRGASLDILLNCTVEKLNADEGHVRSIQTSRGLISLPDDETKVILCSGVSIPISSCQLTRQLISSRPFPMPQFCSTASSMPKKRWARD